METVTHHGRETAYRLTRPDGPGPTVLYVHGSGGSHHVWAYQYGPDGPSHPAVALDLSGHGASDDVDTEPGEETLEAYAQDLTAVAEATDTEVLVGNSLGGAVVFRALLEHPVEPSLAVFAGSGAKLGVHERLRTLLAEDFEEAIEFMHAESRLFYDADEKAVERSKTQVRDTGQAVTERDFLTCHVFDVRDSLEEIEVPSLAVVGEYDELTPPTYHEYLAEEIPNCDVAIVEDAAHLAMMEQPDAFNTTLNEKIEQVEKSTE